MSQTHKYQQDIALPFTDILELFYVAQNMIIQIRLGNAAQNITYEERKEQKNEGTKNKGTKRQRNKKANRLTC